MSGHAEKLLQDIRNLKVDEYASYCTITIQRDAHMDEAKKLMEENGIRHIPVMENGKPVGIISDRDISNVPPESPLCAGDVMTPDPFVMPAGTFMRDVVYEMSSKKIGSALIQSGDTLMIFTSIDALNALNEVLKGGIA